TIGAPRGREQRPDPFGKCRSAHLPGCRCPIVPFVEPGLRDPQHPAGDRLWHAVAGPLVGDEVGHGYFVASFTHRTTERLRTSRSIRSSAFSCRNRASSAASDSPSPPAAAL